MTALGAIGKLGAFANPSGSGCFVEAEADVKAAALDPSDKKPIKLVYELCDQCEGRCR